jgi:hypothetical protein
MHCPSRLTMPLLIRLRWTSIVRDRSFKDHLLRIAARLTHPIPPTTFIRVEYVIRVPIEDDVIASPPKAGAAISDVRREIATPSRYIAIARDDRMRFATSPRIVPDFREE